MKSAVKQYVQEWTDSFHEAVQAWKTFWFAPADPYLLGIIRLLTGWMLVYNLLVWSIDLHDFFGPHGLQPLQTILDFHRHDYVFSFWFYVPEAWITTAHWTCVGIATAFFLGIGTRVTSVLAYLITISYSQRVPIANFGLDQILGMLCLYLAIGPSGACLSIDSWWRKRTARRQGKAVSDPRSSSARIAMRLIQLHMCVIYFWAGVSKLKGDSWYTGEAIWQVLANQEYQTLDLTWLAWMPWVPYLISHVTVLWEIMFCVLVWVPQLRSFMLLMGAFMHFGIGAFLGMWTFGLIMTYAYFAFSDPTAWRSRLGWLVAAGRTLVGLPGSDDPTPAPVPGVPARSKVRPAVATSAAVPAAMEATSVPAAAQFAAAESSEPAFESHVPGLPQPATADHARQESDVVAETARAPAQTEILASLDVSKPQGKAQSLPAGGHVAAFSPDPAAATLQPLTARPPQPATPVVANDSVPPAVDTPVIPRQSDGRHDALHSLSGATPLNPEAALLLVALNKVERRTLRRYFRKLDVLCRAAATTSNVLALAARIRPVAVLVAGTQLSSDALITLLEDLEDTCSAPVLALVSSRQAKQLNELGLSTRILTYPVSPRQIHGELKYMLFGDEPAASHNSSTATPAAQ